MESSTLFAALSRVASQQQWYYVYPVLSRRARGISLGINLHPNRVCNWQCVYCQVPGLHRGHAPTIHIPQLISELQACLQWLSEHMVAGQRMHSMVSDIAFAGDGEPTTSPQFAEAMEAVAALYASRAASDRPHTLRVITNGSQLHHAHVQHALHRLAALDGEVWFKLDAGTDEEMRMVNQAHLPVALHLLRLKTSIQCCPTWVQTAVLSRTTPAGAVTTPSLDAYLALLEAVKTDVAGVLLYAISRPSQQPGSENIVAVPVELIEHYATSLREAGFTAQVFTS